MRVLITGASGFIGASIAQQLKHKDGFEVTGTGRSEKSDYFNRDELNYLQIDLTNFKRVLNFDICIHCAGLADDGASRDELFQNNVIATRNLIKNLTGCKHIIFISSSSVYDFSDNSAKKEEDATLLRNLSEYGRSKLLAENEILNSKMKKITILRPRAVYGVGDRILYPRILKRLKGRFFIVPGNMKVETSLTNVKNLVKVIERITEINEPKVSIYNVADKETYIMKDIFRLIGEVKKNKIYFITLPIGLVKLLIKILNKFRLKLKITKQSIDYVTKSSVLNIDKINEQYKFDVTYNLEDFLELKRKLPVQK